MKHFIVAMAFLPTLALGCLHFDKNFRAEIKEGTKTAFLFHDGTNAHLVIRTDLRAVKGNLPKEVAWVMPFPALPSKYEEVGNEIFDELTQALNPHWGYGDGMNGPGRGKAGSVAKSLSFKVHDVKVVGNYQITPIEILSESDGREFNEWLETNHYNAMPLENQKYYLKKGEVFLAIKAKTDGNLANLKPLHIVYASPTLSLPLKFTHDTRTFDVELFTLTKKPVPQDVMAKAYLSETGRMPSENVSADRYPKLAALVGKQTGVYTKFEAKGLNTAGKSLKDLEQDPTLQP